MVRVIERPYAASIFDELPKKTTTKIHARNRSQLVLGIYI